MKKYKLLKDTPTIKADTILVERYKEGKLVLTIYDTWDGLGYRPYIEKEGITNFNEWFEEVKEFKEWKPKHGNDYKTLNDEGLVAVQRYLGDEADLNLLSIGNYYPLDTPDEAIIKEQKLIPQAMHRLKTAAKKAWFEFNGSEGKNWTEWNNGYGIHYCHYNKAFEWGIYTSLQVGVLPVFPTKESAQAYIDSHKDDLKLLFGIEE